MGVRVHLRHVDGETGHTYADMINKSTVKNFAMNNDVKVHAQGSRDKGPIKPKEKCNIDYNLCINKPSINGHTLIGDIKGEELELIGKINGYAEITKVKDYLYETYYNSLDYDFAKQYFLKNKATLGIGGCSAVRNGNWYGRNLDWTYDENAEFIVRVPRLNNRYASLGIAGNIENATMDFIDSRVYSDIYKIIPFRLLDGINEKGVVINTNVVPTDKGVTTESIPTLEKLDTICTSMLPRYVLDHFATAKEAADFIQQHLSLYPPKTLTQQKYEAHWIIADINETYLLEIINNVVVITNMTKDSNSPLAGKPYMTNFYLSDIVLNSNGTVYTPDTQDSEHDAIKTNLITPNGAGLERYNIIVNNYENANTKAGMRSLMDLLTYTNAYKEGTNPTWHTEYVGLNNLTCVSTPKQFVPVEELVRKIYRERTRDGLTWQTTHSSIYDFANRKLFLIVQEDDEELEITYNILTGDSGNDYATKEELNQKQDKISAGANILIDRDNEISAIVPTLLSELINDSGYITQLDVDNSINNHDLSDIAHNDIRQNIDDTNVRINNIENLIPTETSIENKLVDKAYVDNIIGDVESLLHELDSGGGVE